MESTHGTLKFSSKGAVLFAQIDAPPFNLIGPELVSDLVQLIKTLDQGEPFKVVVFSSANPDFFLSHVDTTRIKEYREAAAALTGEPSIALLFRRLSKTKAVTIAQIEGRVYGAGSEFIMACDLRFGSKERAILNQNEGGMGVLPGGGALQFLSHLMSRGRALEVLLTADDYHADLAELYGWINRSVLQDEIAAFIAAMADRISRFPSQGVLEIKTRMNHLTLSPEDNFREDSDAFLQGLKHPEAQDAIKKAAGKGFGTTAEAELDLGKLLGSS